MKYFNNVFIKTVSLSLSCLLMLAACKEDKFKIKGEISGGDDQTIVLEKSDFNGRWFTVDSIKLKSNGAFNLSVAAPNSPDIYRLEYNGKYIYFPVDSTETITVNSSLSEFGHDFTLSGSSNAELMEKFEKELMALPKGVSVDSLADFKKNVYSNYMKDSQGSILSYYILTKIVGDKPLYDPNNPTDTKYFGAVATGFKTVRPDDPHTKLLEQTTLNSLKRRNVEAGKYQQLEAEEISLIDIEFPDEKGKMQKLSEIAGKGKKVVVIFSLLSHPDSPALNMELAEIYNRNKGNVEFYNVSLDDDQYAWRESAGNIPWITVFAPASVSGEVMAKYNVTEIPVFFIYDADGSLSGRVDNVEDLEKKIR